MRQLDWEQICSRVREIAARAAAYIADERRRFTTDKVETKGVHNFVSYVDKGAERMIVEALGTLLPEAGFVAEEGVDARTTGRRISGSSTRWTGPPISCTDCRRTP